MPTRNWLQTSASGPGTELGMVGNAGLVKIWTHRGLSLGSNTRRWAQSTTERERQRSDLSCGRPACEAAPWLDVAVPALISGCRRPSTTIADGAAAEGDAVGDLNAA